MRTSVALQNSRCFMRASSVTCSTSLTTGSNLNCIPPTLSAYRNSARGTSHSSRRWWLLNDWRQVWRLQKLRRR